MAGTHRCQRRLPGECSTSYDEVLQEISSRIDESGSIGKADIGALVFWKRLRADTTWAMRLHSEPERDVRRVTARAVTAVRDSTIEIPEAAKRGRTALSSLPGFRGGDALASALLVAAAPDRMAVYDTRAHRALTALDIELSSSRGRYSRYMKIMEGLAHEAEGQGLAWSPRDVDKALYWLSASSR